MGRIAIALTSLCALRLIPIPSVYRRRPWAHPPLSWLPGPRPGALLQSESLSRQNYSPRTCLPVSTATQAGHPCAFPLPQGLAASFANQLCPFPKHFGMGLAAPDHVHIPIHHHDFKMGEETTASPNSRAIFVSIAPPNPDILPRSSPPRAKNPFPAQDESLNKYLELFLQWAVNCATIPLIISGTTSCCKEGRYAAGIGV